MTGIQLNINFQEFNHFKLCFIENGVAFFTTKDVTEQWGDDWNDAPYEYNAGSPYSPIIFSFIGGEKKLREEDWNADGTPKYQLLQLNFMKEKFHTSSQYDIYEPCDGHSNSPYSVEDINVGRVPWLMVEKLCENGRDFETQGQLFAGATVAEFVEFIEQYDGVVLVPTTGLHPYPKAMPDLAFNNKKGMTP